MDCLVCIVLVRLIDVPVLMGETLLLVKSSESISRIVSNAWFWGLHIVRVSWFKPVNCYAPEFFSSSKVAYR